MNISQRSRKSMYIIELRNILDKQLSGVDSLDGHSTELIGKTTNYC